MTARTARILSLALAATAMLGTTGCTKVRGHQGYVFDPDLVNAIQPGVDNRQSVLATLGRPSFTSEFNQGEWYYLSRDTRNLAFNRAAESAQTTIRISFDPKGNVAGIAKLNADQIVSVDPAKKTTPTLGRKRTLFQEIFGNIGSVSAPGAAAGGGGGQGGGGGGGGRP